jgi:hypothetical protein
MAESVDDSFARANAEIAALKKTKPKSAAEARLRAVELSRLQQDLIEASKRVVDANAAKRIANGGNGHAKPVAGEATSLSDGVLTGLARGLVPFLRETIANAVNPLIERIAAPRCASARSGFQCREN